jgi:type I restriction enzyme, R subunit
VSKWLTEQDVEDITLGYFRELGYDYVHGGEIAPDGERPERDTFAEVLLYGRLKDAVARLNPGLPAGALAEAVRRVRRLDATTLVSNNEAFHDLLVQGVTVEIAGPSGEPIYPNIKLVDFDHAEKNEFLAVNQYTVKESKQARRPDIVIFVNGIPLGLFELKNAAADNAGLDEAYQQIQTYKLPDNIPTLFHYNSVLVTSDGISARIGSVTAGKERFARWRTIEGEGEARTTDLELEVLVKGVFEKRRLLELLRSFVVFEHEDGGSVAKKIAGYHQFHAVETAVQATIRATSSKGDRKAGVIWHTQGSGKSLTMAFYAGKVIQTLDNPTIVVITDRNDLDGQLFGTFCGCAKLLRQTPVQAAGRDDLREKLKVASGGVIFTTIQKFLPDSPGERFPLLSDRRNIVVIADEAHRSQYGLKAKLVVNEEGSYKVPSERLLQVADSQAKVVYGKDGKPPSTPPGAHMTYGFARHLRDALPNASFIAFTGTPVSLTDRNTRAVFGEYISIYDIQQAVSDGATVPIYYESRVAKLELPEDLKPFIDEEFEEITEDEEEGLKQRLKSRWAQLEALVGSDRRLSNVAADIVGHFERRNAQMPGKGMIVCMSRRICVKLYEEIRKRRPDWHHDDDDKGEMKVVMTGSASDVAEFQPHIRNKVRREDLATRFKRPDDSFKLVIVRDMWLTGFDAPVMHSMYLDKPMQGHGLMQAIARVNRVFRDKPGGLVVDYIGLVDSLKSALADYTQSGGKGHAAEDPAAEALPLLMEQVWICRGLFHGFDFQRFFAASPIERLKLLPAAQEHILDQDDGKQRFVDAVLKLTKANALCGTLDEAIELEYEVAFFQAVKAALVKGVQQNGRTQAELEFAVRQIVNSSLISEEVIDVFAAAGLNRPDISILSDDFLAEVRNLPQKHVAAELLRKLLENEIKGHTKTNLVKSVAFSEMLDESLKRYRNRAVSTLEVIEELIKLAKNVRQDRERGANIGLTPSEVAFYDALAANESAKDLLGDAVLMKMAQELARVIRQNATIDWNLRETVRAKLRSLVRRLLRKYKYPPDAQEKATETVLKQAEILADEWAA